MIPCTEASDHPNEPEIRAALTRLGAKLKSAPRLQAFLRLIVERTLAGEGGRLKAYTIAVEALGRGADFDPQADPIVRVEAARLRRALAAYYAGEGADDPVVITLPRGNYAPTFARRSIAPSRRRWGLPHLQQPGGLGPVRSPGVIAALVGALALGLIITIAMWPSPAAREATASVALTSVSQSAKTVLPVVAVAAFNDAGGSPAPGSALALLRRKLCDALAAFDEVEVYWRSTASEGARRNPGSAAYGAPNTDYLLVVSTERTPDGAAKLTFRFFDLADNTLLWSRTFDSSRAEDDIIGRVAATLAQPYGVIHAHSRARRAAGHVFEAHYACLLDAFDAWPSYDPGRDNVARACLLQRTSVDPTFSAGFAALATIYLREYFFGYGAPKEAASALDRSLAAAQRAIMLKPESARAQQALMDVYFARGERDLLMAAGRKTLALNPHDTYARGTFGMRLIFLGDVETGLPMLRSFLDHRKISAGRAAFALFLASYLTGDDAAASVHAAAITNQGYPLGSLARALAAQRLGDTARARGEFEHLAAFSATWRDQPRIELARLFPAPAVVERLAAALGAM